MNQFGKGKRYRPERKKLVDQITGALIWQLTDHPSINHQLYFTNSSWTPDGRAIILVSYRSGEPNLFRIEEKSGEMLQLTDRNDLNTFSAAPSKDGKRVFFTAGDSVWSVDLRDYKEELLVQFPNSSLGNCSLSHDGELLAIALGKEGFSQLALVKSDGSGSEIIFEKNEIGHIQFCPSDKQTILYSSDITQRMWLINSDGTNNRPLYPQEPSEWITHESWLGLGHEVIFSQWPKSLKAISKDGKRVRTIIQLNAWHASSRADGSLIVCDTNLPDIGLQLIDPQNGDRRTLCYPRASSKGFQWKYAYPATDMSIDKTIIRSQASAASAKYDYSETTYGPQWTHPHPAFNPAGDKVIYTSDCTGHSQVYVAVIE